MVTRRVVRFPAPALAGLEWPVFEAAGARGGPRTCLLAGVHGCEYSSIAAVVQFMRRLDVSTLSGSIVAVPLVSPTSFAARSPFVVPEDGQNLNRSFPGDPDGSFTDVLAHHVFSEFVVGSDVLVDLHGGDLVEALEPFVLIDDSPVREQAERLARAFGLRYVVCDTTDTLGGTTSAAAAAAGIPGFIAEAGGQGLLEQVEVERHIRGLRSTLRTAGVLDGEPDPPPADQQLVERFLWLRPATASAPSAMASATCSRRSLHRRRASCCFSPRPRRSKQTACYSASGPPCARSSTPPARTPNPARSPNNSRRPAR